MMEKGICPVDKIWKAQTFVYNGQCVPMFEIPADKHRYGKLPSCKGKPDGSYLYPSKRCDAYYTCRNGTAHGIKCQENHLFDIRTGNCVVPQGPICT